LIDVLIADDHPLLRKGIRHLLEQESDFRPPGEAENATEVIQRIQEKSWDVIVLDIAMPGRSGLETLLDVKQIRPQLPVLVLSMHAEDLFAVRAIKAGASGYITKNKASSELVAAIRKVVAGRKYVSPALAEALANTVGAGDRPAHETLSNREFQVFCQISTGKSVSAISEEMGLSVKTVSTYRGRILEKMGMRTNAELMRYAIRNGLVD
jgi:DNA-binding NarL/FixJ family response regulator